MWISRNYLTIFSVFLTASVTDAVIVTPENSLYGPYIAGGDNLAWWDLSGSAQLAGNVIRLTPDEPGKKGALWNKYPIIGIDWEAHLHFHIHGKGSSEYGDGMAIWYVKDAMHAGPIFGSKDLFNGLGVFIDTYDNPADPHNHGHPFISAVVNNGSIPYSHDHDGTDYQVGGCHLVLRNLHWPTKIAISYISNTLTIFVDANGQNIWSECLRSPGVHLPTGYFLGVTANTGTSRSDNHDVVSITALDQLVQGKQWEDKSWVIPHAEFPEIPDYLEEEPTDEELQKIEVKREIREEVFEAQGIKIPVIPLERQKPEVKFEVPKMPEMKPHVQEHKKPELHEAKKYEVHEHKKPEFYEHKKPEVHEHKKPEVHEYKKPEVHEYKKPDVLEQKKVEHEEYKRKPATFLTKVVYISIIGVIMVIGVKLIRDYRTDRRERMLKRLY